MWLSKRFAALNKRVVRQGKAGTGTTLEIPKHKCELRRCLVYNPTGIAPNAWSHPDRAQDWKRGQNPDPKRHFNFCLGWRLNTNIHAVLSLLPTNLDHAPRRGLTSKYINERLVFAKTIRVKLSFIFISLEKIGMRAFFANAHHFEVAHLSGSIPLRPPQHWASSCIEYTLPSFEKKWGGRSRSWITNIFKTMDCQIGRYAYRCFSRSE